MPDRITKPLAPIALPPLKMILNDDHPKRNDSEKEWFRGLEKKLSIEHALRRLIDHIKREKK